jgi:hypothetical protein
MDIGFSRVRGAKVAVTVKQVVLPVVLDYVPGSLVTGEAADRGVTDRIVCSEVEDLAFGEATAHVAGQDDDGVVGEDDGVTP